MDGGKQKLINGCQRLKNDKHKNNRIKASLWEVGRSDPICGNIKVEVHATRHVARGGGDPKNTNQEEHEFGCQSIEWALQSASDKRGQEFRFKI